MGRSSVGAVWPSGVAGITGFGTLEALSHLPLPAVGDGAAAVRRAADAPGGGQPHGVVCVAGPDDRVCDLVQERVPDVVPGRSQREADRECDDPNVVPADAARGAGLEELKYGVAHAPSAGLAGVDVRFVAPHLGDGAEDGAPVAVAEEGDDAPHGEVLPREAGVDQLFGPRGSKSAPPGGH